MTTWRVVSTKRVLCFDVEARPGPWAGSDFTFRHMLSLAAVYEDDRDNPIYIGINEPVFANRIAAFAQGMKDCLVVTHNGPNYDLPFLNGTLIRLGMPALGKLLVSDTYAHFPKRGQALSASLGNLAQRFGAEHKKGSMSEVDWDLAYNGDPEAVAKLREYNINDCYTTLDLRTVLLERGLLGAPKVWHP